MPEPMAQDEHPARASKVKRLRTRAQFQALLAHRPTARTRHFSLHRLGVSDAGSNPLFGPSDVTWLGAMVPKRWARRAVTRNAIRRQIHAVGELALAGRGGAHLIRMHSGFPVSDYPSASSRALKCAVRDELCVLLGLETVR